MIYKAMLRYITIFIFFRFLIYASGEAPENKTVANYDASDLLSKIFNVNESMPRAGYASSQYLNEDTENNYFPKENIKFQDDSNNLNDFAEFQDSNKEGLKKRRRKKRKQFYGLQNQVLRPNLGFNGALNPAFTGQYYRPPPPRPSIASGALSAVTEALTSIALNDDHQCVARLLCEAAGGGALGDSGVLQTISGLQPLLTLLSAYNGISTNPLFVFGRAVFLGMSSNGNTASCRYGYPLCPTDPEKLVHYLNNHNGGFFRFFNSPQLGQQNVEQLYNHLTQNYGPHQQQSYGFQNPNPQKYGLYKPNLYSGYDQQNYGLAYPYDNNVRFKSTDDSKIQKRIQNIPLTNIDDLGDFNNKWTFPEAIGNKIRYVNDEAFRDYDFDDNNANGDRNIKALKFPEDGLREDLKYDRKTRGFTFPETHTNRPYRDYNNDYTVNAYNNLYNKYYTNKNVNANDGDRGVRTVYIVRGNGDPNKPEIVNLRPGETLH